MLAVVGEFAVQPILHALREQALPKQVMESVLRERFTTIALVWADAGYAGRLLVWARNVVSMAVSTGQRTTPLRVSVYGEAGPPSESGPKHLNGISLNGGPSRLTWTRSKPSKRS